MRETVIVCYTYLYSFQSEVSFSFDFPLQPSPVQLTSKEMAGNEQNLLSYIYNTSFLKILKIWKMTSMKEDLNGRQHPWKITMIEDDLNSLN